MSQRVTIAAASPLLELVVRRALGRSPHLETSSSARDARAALVALRQPATLSIVDAELLDEGTEDGAALRKELLALRTAAMVVDARATCAADAFSAAPAIVVLRGRFPGELDLEAVETQVLAAVGSALRRRSAGDAPPVAPPTNERDVPEGALELVVIGVSTGGPSLLVQLVARLRAPAMRMLIAQHMPESETPGLAARLRDESGLDVREVAAGPLPAAGTIGLLRGGQDFRVVRGSEDLKLRGATLPGNPFHPNVDEVLLSSLAAGVSLGAVILTGMGQDGAAGALALTKHGLPVIAQRPDTCAVAGMPRAVIELGAARWVQAPEAIVDTLNRWSEAVRQAARGGEPHA